MERSIELASAELVEQNAQLQRDLEAIKRLELELRQAEKLRAVGQLAAGVAHEINTPIQYIGDSIQFVKQAFVGLLKLAEQLSLRTNQNDSLTVQKLCDTADAIDMDFLLEEVPKAIEQTEDGVRRVTGIVSAMKDFGRADSREKTLADVNRCVTSTLLVAQNELKYVADVEVTLGELPLIPCFAGELNQVLLNLLVNAAHAIAERQQQQRAGRGRICVSTKRHDECVIVTIADDGTGIAPEHQTRVFEPFFTTKAVGAGTGQGLAIARSIVVEKHGGALWFESKLGGGTTFFISLPISEGREAEPQSLRRTRHQEVA